MPVDVGTYLLNEKRDLLHSLEYRHRVSVMLIPSPALEIPNYEIQRIRGDEMRGKQGERSYHLVREEPEAEALPDMVSTRAAPEEIEPANNRHSHTQNSNKCFFAANKIRIKKKHSQEPFDRNAVHCNPGNSRRNNYC